MSYLSGFVVFILVLSSFGHVVGVLWMALWPFIVGGVLMVVAVVGAPPLYRAYKKSAYYQAKQARIMNEQAALEVEDAYERTVEQMDAVVQRYRQQP
ncbi:hypothetical protein ACFPM7_28040 [Actinokineospora guangxiensis]|uniref:Uncharacterized protein n=1 Tax=Actinokineospora guangxiensis TaxID=1490288 RepID=A0ABW0EU70_9PSEU